ncbi:MAG: hypothetical protein AAF570_19810, partial [Bacteroidota bacterium]
MNVQILLLSIFLLSPFAMLGQTTSKKRPKMLERRFLLRATAVAGISGLRTLPVEPSGQGGSTSFELRGLGTGFGFGFGIGYEVVASRYLSFVHEFEF